MKAKDLRERSTDDLQQLHAMLKKDVFSYRMRNYTNQLDDTSLLRKSRRDIARIELILHERALEAAGAEPAVDGGNES
jgi:large subunit ribosomal protein L29